jgi:hypothetical protein
MPENKILAEIRRSREIIVRENDCDVAKLFAHFRDVSAKLEAEGWRVAAPESGGTRSVAKDGDPSCVVREETPKKQPIAFQSEPCSLASGFADRANSGQT